MIISDLMKNGAVFHVLHELAIDLDCGCGDACFSIYYANIST
jgi:hypothetical protein